VLGGLVIRGLDEELWESAYAIVDGRPHHVRFADIELTGDAMPGAVVEVRVSISSPRRAAEYREAADHGGRSVSVRLRGAASVACRSIALCIFG
jgi:hypothetical protein